MGEAAAYSLRRDYVLKYDLLVYLGLVPVVVTTVFALTVVMRAMPTDTDIEIRRMRLAGGTLCALFSLFIFTGILYFVDATGAGKEIFEKAYAAILALVGTIIGYIFGATRK
jgi:hypothetical protein